MFVYRSIEARSCNKCCSGKAISITYSECSSVALGIQHAPYCHLCPAPLYNNFPYYLINDMVFERTLVVIPGVGPTWTLNLKKILTRPISRRKEVL